MPGYGAVPAAGTPAAGMTRRRVTVASVGVGALAALALVAAVCLTALGASGVRRVALADPGYLKWLKTLNGPADYQTGKEYDDRFDSQSMPHMDSTHLVPSALPGTKKAAHRANRGATPAGARGVVRRRPLLVRAANV